MDEKSRVSYPKHLRDSSKAQGKGLFTVHVKLPDGTQEQYQGCADAMELRFVRWAAGLTLSKESRPLPNLEEFVRQFLKSELTP